MDRDSSRLLSRKVASYRYSMAPQSSLQNLINFDTAGIKVVGVFRSEESAKKVLARLGNPVEENLYPLLAMLVSFDFT